MFFKVSTVHARTTSIVRDIIGSIHQLCEGALNVNRPLLIENEQQLRDQGYGKEYIAGLDHVRETLQLVERLRADKIDFSTYHIQEFAGLIGPRIDFVEKGIRSQESDDKEMRLNLLESLRSEVQNRPLITYQDWFNLNFLLSILATPVDKMPSFLRDINALIANRTIEDTIFFFQRLEKKY